MSQLPESEVQTTPDNLNDLSLSLSKNLLTKIDTKIKQRERKIKKEIDLLLEQNGNKILNFLHQYLNTLVESNNLNSIKGSIMVRSTDIFFTRPLSCGSSNHGIFHGEIITADKKSFVRYNGVNTDLIFKGENIDFLLYPQITNLGYTEHIKNLVVKFLDDSHFKVKAVKISSGVYLLNFAV